MSTFTVQTDCGTERSFDTRRDAEDGKRTHAEICEECDGDAIRIATRTDGGQAVRPTSDAPASDPDPGFEIPDSVRTDPLDVVPDYMIDVVEGQPTINKRGYAVIANHFDIVVQAKAITAAGETDHEYAEFVARAWRKDDGPENAYTGHGTARATEDRRGIRDNLNEMAETRAMKRAVAWASGVGILAWEEMAGYLDDE